MSAGKLGSVGLSLCLGEGLKKKKKKVFKYD